VPRFKIAPNVVTLNNIANASGSRTTISLNSAFVNGVSGAAAAIRLNALDTDPITDAYFYIDSFTGTKANVTMQCTVYNETPSNSARAGTTVRATSTTTTLPAGTSGWVRFEFATPYSPANVGEVVWIVASNTAAIPATNFPNIVNNVNIGFPAQSFILGITTANGFSANGTGAQSMCAFFVQGGRTRGNTLTVAATPVATNTRMRGVVVTPPVDCTVAAWQFQTAVGSTMTEMVVFESTQLPNDTPIYSFTTGQTGRASAEVGGTISFEPPLNLKKGKTYYIGYRTSANSITPGCIQTQDYTAIQAVADNNVDEWTLLPLVRDTGSNTWAVERNNTPRMQLIVNALDNPTITAGF